MTTYVNTGTINRIIDGDTIIINVDLGYNITATQHFRVDGINAPEHNTTAGQTATNYLTTLIPPTTRVTVTCSGPDKYGNRWLATITTPDGLSIGTEMLSSGNAFAWNGLGKKPTAPPTP